MALCLFIAGYAQTQNLKLWYKQPAWTWVEALPLGNSRMGVMVYGGTAREELQIKVYEYDLIIEAGKDYAVERGKPCLQNLIKK